MKNDDRKQFNIFHTTTIIACFADNNVLNVDCWYHAITMNIFLFEERTTFDTESDCISQISKR